MRIRAATAWKKNLHWLSDKSFNRLKDAGLISPDNIKKAVNGIAKKVKVKDIVHNADDVYYSYYIPTFKQYKKAYPAYPKNILAQALKPHRKVYGRIAINEDNLKNELGIKTLPDTFKDDLLHHEYQEALVMQDIAKGRHKLQKYESHNSVTVPINERKMFNQTGGMRTREDGVANIQHLRQNNPNEGLEIVAPTMVRQRLRNLDYKRIAREAKRKFDVRKKNRIQHI